MDVSGSKIVQIIRKEHGDAALKRALGDRASRIVANVLIDCPRPEEADNCSGLSNSNEASVSPSKSPKLKKLEKKLASVTSVSSSMLAIAQGIF